MAWRAWVLGAAWVAGAACAGEAPVRGPERLAWMRERLRNTVSKFEFTQGYTFRKHPDRLKPFLAAIKARGFNVWDQHAAGYIWGDEQFASLERSLQAADDVGLKVWATLVPPSEKAELRRMPEAQRRAYFVTCVERFARLAAKYPSFVAFTCDDFSHDLGFFTPEVLVEVEHERCPYTGVAYERQGAIAGVFPLLTARREGKGLVVRHYAAVSPGAVLGDAYKRLLANIVHLAE